MAPVKLDPEGYFRRIPLAPEQMVDRVTRAEDTIVLCHLGVPRISPDNWSLNIDGLVRHKLQLTLEDLKRRERVEIASVHQCAGNPLEPTVATRRVCSVIWGGVRLVNLLEECGPLDNALFLWSAGADYGEFKGHSCDAYTKDLPVERIHQDVLLAYEMNYTPLSAENGFPVRLVVPGFYGTNSVKWLTRIELADRRAPGPFTMQWYNDPILDDAGQPTGSTKPVWAIEPESVIVAPAAGETLKSGEPAKIWGWAWGDGGVSAVEVSVDSCRTWSKATLEPSTGRMWQKFEMSWLPAKAGTYEISARAWRADGACQPLSGARNTVHRVGISVS